MLKNREVRRRDQVGGGEDEERDGRGESAREDIMNSANMKQR